MNDMPQHFDAAASGDEHLPVWILSGAEENINDGLDDLVRKIVHAAGRLQPDNSERFNALELILRLMGRATAAWRAANPGSTDTVDFQSLMAGTIAMGSDAQTAELREQLETAHVLNNELVQAELRLLGRIEQLQALKPDAELKGHKKKRASTLTIRQITNLSDALGQYITKAYELINKTPWLIENPFMPEDAARHGITPAMVMVAQVAERMAMQETLTAPHIVDGKIAYVLRSLGYPVDERDFVMVRQIIRAQNHIITRLSAVHEKVGMMAAQAAEIADNIESARKASGLHTEGEYDAVQERLDKAVAELIKFDHVYKQMRTRKAVVDRRRNIIRKLIVKYSSQQQVHNDRTNFDARRKTRLMAALRLINKGRHDLMAEMAREDKGQLILRNHRLEREAAEARAFFQVFPQWKLDNDALKLLIDRMRRKKTATWAFALAVGGSVGGLAIGYGGETARALMDGRMDMAIDLSNLSLFSALGVTAITAAAGMFFNILAYSHKKKGQSANTPVILLLSFIAGGTTVFLENTAKMGLNRCLENPVCVEKAGTAYMEDVAAKQRQEKYRQERLKAREALESTPAPKP